MATVQPVHRAGAMSRLSPRDHVSRLDAVGVGLPRGVGPDAGDSETVEQPMVCSEGEDALSLAVDAARDCLARSRHPPEDIEMVISAGIAHQTTRGRAFRLEPSLSLAVKSAIGAPDAVNVNLSHYCAGMLTGVLLLDDFIARGVVRCGMVVSGECLSRLGPGDRRRLHEACGPAMANRALTDAGAAVLVERSPDARPGIAFATFTTAPMLGEAFGTHGLSTADIDWLLSDVPVAMVPGAEARPPGRPLNVVPAADRFGNAASATPFLALDRCLADGRFRRGERVAMLAAAPDQLGVLVLVVDDLAESHGRAH